MSVFLLSHYLCCASHSSLDSPWNCQPLPSHTTQHFLPILILLASQTIRGRWVPSTSDLPAYIEIKTNYSPLSLSSHLILPTACDKAGYSFKGTERGRKCSHKCWTKTWEMNRKRFQVPQIETLLISNVLDKTLLCSSPEAFIWLFFWADQSKNAGCPPGKCLPVTTSEQTFLKSNLIPQEETEETEHPAW